MPKLEGIKKILVIGSGPIVIGQAAEFDYSGSQACVALKENGYEVVLINNNPATIMTDHEMADKIYMEPLEVDIVASIIQREKPDAMLATLGGQTGLNLAMDLAKEGILDKFGVKLLGTDVTAIDLAEDRELFRNKMLELGISVPESDIVSTIQGAIDFANEIGYPVIVRPAFTLGGSGGGIADTEEELRSIVANGLLYSPVNQCLIERSIKGFKEIEYEVMRDSNDGKIIVCNMENVDPVGVHTGDSIVVAPTQTLTNYEYQMLRDVSLKIVSELNIIGGCNVQLALDSETSNYYVIEVNPRVSRSSALASKVTGYPIARLATLVSVGYRLDEIVNPVTKKTFAAFEPTIDYIVSKIPRWPFDKFTEANRELGTQMKATGEVMGIGRNFEESILKSVRSLELGIDHLIISEVEEMTKEELLTSLVVVDDLRIFSLARILRENILTPEEIFEQTAITPFFIDKFVNIINMEKEIANNVKCANTLLAAKSLGFADSYIAKVWDITEEELREIRKTNGITPVYKRVDTCAAEFISETDYMYSTYEQYTDNESSDNKKVLVIGSGPIRIGQGVEFDYSTVHAVKSLKAMGYEALMINNNPETVSTDFSISDKLFFEPVTFECVMDILEQEKNMEGVIVQFGGQTPLNLAAKLEKAGVKILGTSVESINEAEDRKFFEAKLSKNNINQPIGGTALSLEEAIEIANRIEYPVLVRPSFVLGGRAMKIVYNDNELTNYFKVAIAASDNNPVLVDKYLVGREIEVDAISDGEVVLIPGIMEHIEKAGVHSGDSMSVYPMVKTYGELKQKVIDYTNKIGKIFNVKGLFNIQFIVTHDDVYVIEVNPRASRTVPFLSKITKTPMVDLATRISLGETMSQLGYFEDTYKEEPNKYYIKAPIFSFNKLRGVDISLSPEMKSTGEAIGIGKDYQEALHKAFIASKVSFPLTGKVYFTLSDEKKAEGFPLAKLISELGFDLVTTKGTAKYFADNGLNVQEVVERIENDNEKDILQRIRDKEFDFVVNTTGGLEDTITDAFLIRRNAVEVNVPVFTSLDTFEAYLEILKLRKTGFYVEEVN